MITSLISMKGGTAKTTTAVNLAAYLALGQFKTLLIDLDPQTFATIYLGVEIQEAKVSMSDVLLKGSDLCDAICPTRIPNMDLIPSDRRLASVDLLLAATCGREEKLRQKLEPIRDGYDYILIDNAPSLNLLSVNALVASDNYVITVSPSFFSMVGLQTLLETVEVIKKNMDLKVELLGILPTLVDLRMKITSEYIELLRNHFQEKVFRTVIRQNVKLLESPAHGKTIFEYDSGCVGALCYIYFGKEFLARCTS